MVKTKIKDYLTKNKSSYIGHYRLHGSVKTNAFEYKFRYYTRDQQFREISVYLTIDCSNDEINHTFSVRLNNEEEKYILKDALEIICLFEDHKTILHSHILEVYIRSKSELQFLEPQDYRNILDYLEYHKGVNEEVIEEFYGFFMPYIRYLLKIGSYHKLFGSMELLLDRIVYEYEWDGASSKFLDRQYQLHMPYIYQILKSLIEKLDDLKKSNSEELVELFQHIFSCERFSLLLVTNYQLPEDLNKRFLEFFGQALESLQNQKSLAVRYVLSMYQEEDNQEVAFDILRFVMEDILVFANHQVERSIGDRIIEEKGYNFIIRLFTRDYNTFVFVCFPISSFPEKYHTIIRLELETAIRYYAARMDHDRYRLSSFEQVANINRLLLENYKEYYKNGKE